MNPKQRYSMKYVGVVAIALMSLALPGGHALAAEEPPAVVEVAQVTSGSDMAILKLPGTVLSKQDAEISAEVTGRLTWVAEVGEYIAQGEPLVSKNG